MSDRVAIIGGSEVGVDHFPFPTSGTGFNLSFDIQTLCFLFYVVKTWDVEVVLAVGDNHSDEGHTFTLPACLSQDNTLITREAELCLTESAAWALEGGPGGTRSIFTAFGTDQTADFDLQMFNSESPFTADSWNGTSLHFGDDIQYTMIATPSEFWPHKLRNGDSVWDVVTGAQLQDPLADYDVDDIEETITQAIDGVPSTLIIHRNPSPWLAV